MKSNRVLALAVAVACLLPATGSATVYLNNSSSPHSGSASIQLIQWVASRFKTPVDAQSFRLDSVTLWEIYKSTPGGNFLVSIYACNGTAENETVGSLIGDLVGSSSPDTINSYIYYTSTDIILQYNTSYWLVARVTSGSADYRVSYCYDSINSVVGSGWSFASTRVWSYSSTQGATWGFPGDYYPYRYAVDATPLPEPGSALILSMTFFSAMRVRRLKWFKKPDQT